MPSWKRCRDFASVLVLSSIIQFCTPSIASPFEMFSEKKYEKKNDTTTEEIFTKARNNMAEHLRRKDIYPENFTGTTLFKKEDGFDIPQPRDYYNNALMSQFDLESKLAGPTDVLTDENFPDWEYFLADLIAESVGDVAIDKIKKTDLWRRFALQARGLSKISLSLNETPEGKNTFSYYIPTRDYSKLQEYEKRSGKSKLKFDVNFEVENLNLLPSGVVKARFKHLPKIDLGLYPFNNYFNLDVYDRLGDFNVGLSSEYNYGDGYWSNGLYVSYPFSDDFYLMIRANGNKDNGWSQEYSLRAIWRF